VGTTHACAVLTGGGVKCWGKNNFGELGYGDTLSRGAVPGEMGVNLPSVDLGGVSVVTAVAVGEAHSCALFGNSTVKCWGANTAGQLGYGDTLTRGTNPSDMGNNLPTIDFGQGIRAISAAGHHTCVLFNYGVVKCWGSNQYGELGLGDTNNRGDEPGEMGDALPEVDVGF
jgi:alpha-tubulin suppressor-like RCC1 family protein